MSFNQSVVRISCLYHSCYKHIQSNYFIVNTIRTKCYIFWMPLSSIIPLLFNVSYIPIFSVICSQACVALRVISFKLYIYTRELNIHINTACLKHHYATEILIKPLKYPSLHALNIFMSPSFRITLNKIVVFFKYKYPRYFKI